MVMENWLAPHCANCAAVGTFGSAAINVDRHEEPGSTLVSYCAARKK